MLARLRHDRLGVDRRRDVGVEDCVLRRQARCGAAREAVGEGAHRIVVLEPFCERGAGDRVACPNRRQAGAERVFLEVRPSNLRARAIYEEAGFEFLSLRRKYYGPPRKEDALVYALAL